VGTTTNLQLGPIGIVTSRWVETDVKERGGGEEVRGEFVQVFEGWATEYVWGVRGEGEMVDLHVDYSLRGIETEDGILSFI